MNIKGRFKLLILAGCLGLFMTMQVAFGEDAWQMDFDATCAQSNDAMTLSVNELKLLIEKCDRLQKVVEAQDETVRKVYSKRLQLCKNLYVFVLESKIQEQQSK
jgi:C4-dicarboxylate-specific signal transduction histidine kinase